MPEWLQYGIGVFVVFALWQASTAQGRIDAHQEAILELQSEVLELKAKAAFLQTKLIEIDYRVNPDG